MLFRDRTDAGRELAAQLIDAMAAQGHCEFMSAVAEPLPVQVFLKMLGLPLEKLPEYRELVREHHGLRPQICGKSCAERRRELVHTSRCSTPVLATPTGYDSATQTTKTSSQSQPPHTSPLPSSLQPYSVE